MFTKLLMRFKWYRRRQLPKALKALDATNDVTTPENYKYWFTLYRESVPYTDKYELRFTPQYDRVVDCVKDIHNLELELDNLNAQVGEEVPVKDVTYKIKKDILLGDWFVDDDCYRYSGERFEKLLTMSLGRISAGYSSLDYSQQNYFIGKYTSLFLTLRAYVEAINRQ